jgi:response regulator NasT
VLPGDAYLQQRLVEIQPELVIVDAESEARDTLEHVVLATRDERRPIVMFTNESDPAQIKDAVAAGVSAYIVAGLSPERIRPILEVAMARFAREQALRGELQQARDELRERKLIERAKGLLMQRQNLSEPEAYARLRRGAMDKGLRVAELSQRMLDAVDLLG